MKVVIYSILTLFACASVASLEERIVGGNETHEGEFPFMASLRQKDVHVCGAVIIDEGTLLTSAHCVYGIDMSALSVLVGTNDITTGGDNYTLNEIRIYPDFDEKTLRDDIAILKVSTPIAFSENIGAVEILREWIFASENVQLIGWGLTSYPGGNAPKTLQYANLRTISIPECIDRLVFYNVSDANLCTLTRAGEGACMGDSGGPLIQSSSGKLIGIASWEIPCALGKPDVYARVFTYYDWIQENRY